MVKPTDGAPDMQNPVTQVPANKQYTVREVISLKKGKKETLKATPSPKRKKKSGGICSFTG
jgi:hypothetical protein